MHKSLLTELLYILINFKLVIFLAGTGTALYNTAVTVVIANSAFVRSIIVVVVVS